MVEPLPILSCVCSPPTLTACWSISAQPSPGTTGCDPSRTRPPTTVLFTASASGSSEIESAEPLTLDSLACTTAPAPSVPVVSTLSYSNTDQAQTLCCCPPKSNVIAPVLGMAPIVRKQVRRRFGAAVTRSVAICTQLRPLP